MPSITSLATTSPLNAVWNKIPKVIDLVKELDYNGKMSGIEANILLL